MDDQDTPDTTGAGGAGQGASPVTPGFGGGGGPLGGGRPPGTPGGQWTSPGTIGPRGGGATGPARPGGVPPRGRPPAPKRSSGIAPIVIGILVVAALAGGVAALVMTSKGGSKDPKITTSDEKGDTAKSSEPAAVTTTTNASAAGCNALVPPAAVRAVDPALRPGAQDSDEMFSICGWTAANGVELHVSGSPGIEPEMTPDILSHYVIGSGGTLEPLSGLGDSARLAQIPDKGETTVQVVHGGRTLSVGLTAKALDLTQRKDRAIALARAILAA